jgi:hypothetical protein
LGEGIAGALAGTGWSVTGVAAETGACGVVPGAAGGVDLGAETGGLGDVEAVGADCALVGVW